MGQGTLVNEQIEDGKRLLDLLAQAGVVVTAAAWLKEEEGEYWFLYLVTPLVGKNRAASKAYGKVLPVYNKLPEPVWLEPLEIKVIGPTNPIAKDILDIHKKYPNGSNRPLPFRGDRLGYLNVEGSYLYPPCITQPLDSKNLG